MSTSLSRPRTRRALAATIAAAAAFSLSACGTNFSAQTNQQYQAAEGANQRGEIDVMNTVLVTDADGAAVLSAGVVNQTQQTQTITGIEITDGSGKQLAVSGPQATALPVGQIVTLGQGDDPAVYSVASGLTAGSYVTVTVRFGQAEETVIDAPTRERDEMYDVVAEPAAS